MPDSPHSYRAAYKGMLINGINNILLRDGVITKLSVREQTIFSGSIIEGQEGKVFMHEISIVVFGN